MTTGLAGGDRICLRLQESLARLRQDIEQVELWAGALESFSRPIPDYDPAKRYRLPANQNAIEQDNNDTREA